MKHNYGYTLFDILIAISIVGLVFGIGTPNMAKLIELNRAKKTTNELLALLKQARNHAVTVRFPVILCPSVNGTTCVNNWTEDLILFEDQNNNFRYDESDTMVTNISITDESESIIWRSFGSRPYIRYDEFGSTGYQNGRLYYCSKNQNEKQQIIIYRSGRVRVALNEHIIDSCG